MPTQNRKRKVVLASGVFDLLHFGHVKFLEDAKKAGGKNAKLIVVIARDSTVEQTKGRRPIMPENQRLALVESLKVVDEAVLGLEDLDVGGIIGEVKPDVIALGYDQEEMEQRVKAYVQKHDLSIEVLRVGKFGENEIDSSSKIRQRIVEKYAK
jgi:FAD synthetase